MAVGFNRQGAKAARLFEELKRSPGLVGLWPLNEQSGTTVYDRGPNRLNGTISGSPGYSRPLKTYENARQFTLANSEYLSIADNAALSTGDIDFTIAAWVYLDSVAGSMGIAGKAKNTGNQWEWLLYYNASPDRFAFTVSPDGTAGALVDRAANSYGSPGTAAWAFIVAWHDATANTINIQVNNETVDSTAHTTGVFNSTSAFEIGRYDTAQYLGGRVGPTGYWKRVLTSAERTALYRGARWGWAYRQLSDSLKYGLVAWWDLDEASGNATDDYGANTLTDNNTVTSNPGVILLEPYDHYGLALNASPYVDVGDQTLLSFTKDSPFSVALIWTPYGKATTADAYLFGKFSAGQGYFLDARENARDIYWVLGKQDGSDTVQVHASTGSFVDGTAILFALTYTGSSTASGVAMYKNGVALSLVTDTDNLVGSTQASGAGFQIGAAGTTAPVRGDIGLVAVFNRALSAGEMRKLAHLSGFL